jgi:competence protein ComEC
MPGRRLPLPLLLAVAAAVLLSLGRTDEIRARAGVALERGMPAREAALARGFVLGQEERIDDQAIDDFRRSGLSHLLAVSGQNVALLALLAMPLLAALGMPLRTRLVWILGLIAVYVPLAGAGPSIQRAGIMGALSVWATLAGRRASRLFALVVAAVILLALDPGIAADVGWQLSFAAVLGIVLLAPRLRATIAALIGTNGLSGALADGAAMTIAATLATAPLIAFHFEGFSTTTLLANLLALPAVAPSMWLGMLSAGAGQVPGAPVEALNAVNAPLLAYIAQVASWCGRPDWAYLKVRVGAGELLACYLAIAAFTTLAMRLARSRRIAAIRRLRSSRAETRPRGRIFPRLPGRSTTAGKSALVFALATLLVAAALAWTAVGGGARVPDPPTGLRVSIIDVGQGDAILLQPTGAPAVLVDGGPPGEDLVGKLRGAGVERLGAAIVTHDQSDHAGGVEELIGSMPVGRLLFALLGRRTLTEARAAGATTQRLARGDVLRSGSMRLEALWPPPELLPGPHRGEDPNRLALVLLLRWRSFSLLLSADAEAEAIPLDPGPLDVLKVAHHGSEDAGLGGLLDRTRPRLAVISAGEDNPFGHPTPLTLATLAAHGVRTLRTDRDGTIVLDVGRGALHVSSGS